MFEYASGDHNSLRSSPNRQGTKQNHKINISKATHIMSVSHCTKFTIIKIPYNLWSRELSYISCYQHRHTDLNCLPLAAILPMTIYRGRPTSIMLENLPIMLSRISQKSSLLCPSISLLC